MRSSIVKTGVVILLSFFSIQSFSQSGDQFTIDVEQSKVIWTGSKVTGSHSGEIKLESGIIRTDSLTFKSGKFVMDMSSISCTSIDDEKLRSKLENHLKSEDFFDTEHAPTATFVTTKVVHQGEHTYKVQGKLTIKGITRSFRFMTEFLPEGDHLKATADIEIDRSDYNVRYGSGTFFDNLGDRTIFDMFQLKVDLVAHMTETP